MPPRSPIPLLTLALVLLSLLPPALSSPLSNRSAPLLLLTPHPPAPPAPVPTLPKSLHTLLTAAHLHTRSNRKHHLRLHLLQRRLHPRTPRVTPPVATVRAFLLRRRGNVVRSGGVSGTRWPRESRESATGGLRTARRVLSPSALHAVVTARSNRVSPPRMAGRQMELESCETSDSCAVGEVCVAVQPEPVCVEEGAVADFAPGLEVIPPRGGFTGDACERSADCRGERICTELIVGGEVEVCGDLASCACVPPGGAVACENEAQCELGETCVDTGGVRGQVCVSVAITASGGGGVGATPAPPGDGAEVVVVTVEPEPDVEVGIGACCDDGFTGDFCTEDGDCRGDRSCVDNANAGPCSPTESSSCRCAPSSPLSCALSEDCEDGEVCAAIDGTDGTFCISEEAEQNFGFFEEVGSDDTPTPSPTSPTTPGTTVGNSDCCNDGFTLDTCTSSADCRGERTCREDGSVVNIPCTPGISISCACQPLGPVSCSQSSDCEAGEVCSSVPGTAVTTCVSADVVENVDGFDQVGPVTSPSPSTPVETPSEFPTDSPECCNNGFTFDTCASSADCRGDRDCLESDDTSLVSCTDPANDCFCLPEEDPICTDSSDCEVGEVCASVLDIGFFCISEEVAIGAGFEVTGPVGSAEPPTGVESPSEEPLIPIDCCNNGFTLDFCISSADCRGDRNCLEQQGESFESCTDSINVCLCVPPMDTICSDSSDCEAGEVCAKIEVPEELNIESPPNTCVSADVVENVDGLDQVGPVTSPSPSTPVETPSEFPTDAPECCNNGFTFDTCASSADCRGDRDCVENGDNGDTSPVSCTDPGNDCVCIPEEDPICTDSSDCEVGEVCTEIEVPEELNIESLPNICVSADVVENVDEFNEVGSQDPTAVPTEEPTAEPGEEPTAEPGEEPAVEPAEEPTEEPASPICIDASALAHLPRERLVFKEHAIGRVLCDVAGSCATGGHIVVFRGEAMMMRTYCEMVKCERREIYVNSPRYERGTRVKSRTEGLEYTAFAARWETRVEERALVAAVRVGL